MIYCVLMFSNNLWKAELSKQFVLVMAIRNCGLANIWKGLLITGYPHLVYVKLWQSKCFIKVFGPTNQPTNNLASKAFPNRCTMVPWYRYTMVMHRKHISTYKKSLNFAKELWQKRRTNLAYGTHWISWRVILVAPIPF